MTEMATVDARGLACPQPVLETKKMLEEGKHSVFQVLVDNETARENVGRFGRNQGCEVQVEAQDTNEFLLTLRKSGPPADDSAHEELLACPIPEPMPGKGHVVYIATDTMGSGDDALGIKLMRGFLRTWIDVDPKPWRMIFINAGVRLTTIDEEAADAVGMLEEKGVEILSCGTCLQHFSLEDRLRVGKATNMYEVIESLNLASKVISPD